METIHNKTIIDYLWIDGTTPVPTIRSKVKILDKNHSLTRLRDIPIWGFDGSSTNQAPSNASDCVLKPVAMFSNPLEELGVIALCEVYTIEDDPHPTNSRRKLAKVVDYFDSQDPWAGIEQEYTLLNAFNRPLGWPLDKDPAPQGDYYCGRNAGEDIVREHMTACLSAGLLYTGHNAEVMLGQWEYQIGVGRILDVADHLWVARWLLEKIAKSKGATVSHHPKLMEGDWNGAGAHTNFSTKNMRLAGGDNIIHKAIKKLEVKHDEHIKVYGEANAKRLTGKHETCPITEFQWGISDRGASVRIPWQVARDGMGYLEDRRPAANIDPYIVCEKLVSTICD